MEGSLLADLQQAITVESKLSEYSGNGNVLFSKPPALANASIPES